jgi:pentose-5-phosphate-3-epimerase
MGQTFRDALVSCSGSGPICVLPILPHIDGVLLLTAPAGGGGFSSESLKRVRDVPVTIPVRVDGGLRSEHLALPLMSRVELAVVGKALFSAADVISEAKHFGKVLAAHQPAPGSRYSAGS